jgi:hypothetical protein
MTRMSEQERREKDNKYMKTYLANNYKRISLLLSNERDRDILESLNPDNIQGSIKELIRRGLKE